jgi:hypothetical protein
LGGHLLDAHVEINFVLILEIDMSDGTDVVELFVGLEEELERNGRDEKWDVLKELGGVMLRMMKAEFLYHRLRNEAIDEEKRTMVKDATKISCRINRRLKEIEKSAA